MGANLYWKIQIRTNTELINLDWRVGLMRPGGVEPALIQNEAQLHRALRDLVTQAAVSDGFMSVRDSGGRLVLIRVAAISSITIEA